MPSVSGIPTYLSFRIYYRHSCLTLLMRCSNRACSQLIRPDSFAGDATENREDMAPGEASVAEAASVANDAFSLVLEPEAGVCAGLGAIRIDENLFAIGRNEAPFASR